jgi:hypothetical protein
MENEITINLNDVIIAVCGIGSLIWAIDVIWVLYFDQSKNNLRIMIRELEKQKKKKNGN